MEFDDEIMGLGRTVVLRVKGIEGEDLKNELGGKDPAPKSRGIDNRLSDGVIQRPFFEFDKDRLSNDDRDVIAKADAMAISLINPIYKKNIDTYIDTDTDDRNGAVSSHLGGQKVTWGIQAIGAHNTDLDGRNVKIAILDTGIKRDHEAFADVNLNITERDYTSGNMIEGNGVANDENGHGTHCAATIFGRDVNLGGGRGKIRIGVARGINDVLICKVIGGKAGTKQLLEAMDGALAWGANIVSMSLGFDHVRYYQWLLRQQVTVEAALSQTLATNRDNIRMFDATMIRFAAMAQGVRQHTLVVAASGNEANRPSYVVSKSSPAAAIGVLSVGAVEKSQTGYNIAKFSNSDPDIVGPGVDVISAGNTEPLISLSGTSMACPHIAGLAALYWDSLQRKGTMFQITSEMVKSAILSSALNRREELFPNGKQSDYGGGLPGI